MACFAVTNVSTYCNSQLERLIPPSGGLTGGFNQTYLSGLQSTVSYITGKNAYALIEPHNFMVYSKKPILALQRMLILSPLRSDGKQITSASDFATAWKNIANLFKSNSKVVFDLMNEPHDIAATTVAAAMQAAINSIRATGATSQLILVEGTSYTGAWSKHLIAMVNISLLTLP
jgi:endoglucanase